MADEATAPTTAPAAPAAPASTTTTDVKRPATLGVALREAASAGSSSATPASADAHATGTVLPTDAGTATASKTSGPEGPVPYPRFSEVNKAKNAAEEELKALAWAKGLDAQTLLRSIEWHASAQKDPAAFLRQIYAQAPPAIQAQMRGLFVPPQATRSAAALFWR